MGNYSIGTLGTEQYSALSDPLAEAPLRAPRTGSSYTGGAIARGEPHSYS